MSFIQLEAQTLSRQIETVLAFITDLEQVLAGQLAAHPTACDALKAVASQRMPPSLAKPFQNASYSYQDLTGWMSDLQQRLFNLPPGDVDSLVFRMSVFSRPEGFLDAALRHLARQQFKSLHTVYLTIDLVRCTFCCFYLYCTKI